MSTHICILCVLCLILSLPFFTEFLFFPSFAFVWVTKYRRCMCVHREEKLLKQLCVYFHHVPKSMKREKCRGIWHGSTMGTQVLYVIYPKKRKLCTERSHIKAIQHLTKGEGLHVQAHTFLFTCMIHV